jgi:hypothetical protein
MLAQHEIVGVFDFAGIPCRVDCRDEPFRARLASRYADFAVEAPPEVSIQVEVTAALPADAAHRASGPFARFGGQNGVLTIEGAIFRGTFHEKSGEGWINQPPDLAPLETFLTAICAGRILKSRGFLLHAASILCGKEAFVFFGPSGSGKTTVTELIGKGVITDEIAVIRRDAAGYRVSAVPWRGQRLSAPLAGLFRLRKAQETAFIPLSPSQAVRHLLPSVFLPRAELWEVGQFLEIAQDLVKQVPCYEMGFTPDGLFWDAIPLTPTLSRTGERESENLPLSHHSLQSVEQWLPGRGR